MDGMRHFLRGLASVLVLSPKPELPAARSTEEAWAADARALAGDWRKVGGDVSVAFEREATRLVATTRPVAARAS